MDIGKRLVILRNKAGHTQESLAEETGLTRPHIQKLEADLNSPTINTLAAIARACRSSLGEFFESRVVEHYEDAVHQELHEKLQFILEHDEKRANGVAIDIEDIYVAALAEQQKRKAVKRKVGKTMQDGGIPLKRASG